jgi:hypothetical protein
MQKTNGGMTLILLNLYTVQFHAPAALSMEIKQPVSIEDKAAKTRKPI